MSEDIIEITIKPDGSETIKVVQSKGDCQDLTRPFEQAAGGKRIARKRIHNPGLKAGQTQVRREA